MPRPDVSELRRGQILTAALELFSETGIDSTSMNAIAGRCGLSKATIYHYFDSKDDMVISLLNSIFEHDEGAFDALQNQALSVSERLINYAQSYAEIVISQPQLFAVFFEFYSNSIRRELIRETLANYFDIYASVFTTVFQQGFDSAEFQHGDAKVAAETFMALIEGIVMMSFIRKINLVQSIQQSARLLLDSLG